MKVSFKKVTGPALEVLEIVGSRVTYKNANGKRVDGAVKDVAKFHGSIDFRSSEIETAEADETPAELAPATAELVLEEVSDEAPAAKSPKKGA